MFLQRSNLRNVFQLSFGRGNRDKGEKRGRKGGEKGGGEGGRDVVQSNESQAARHVVEAHLSFSAFS